MSSTIEHTSFTDSKTPCVYAVSVDIKKEIGNRIRAARDAKGWSLSELAGKTKTLTKSRISNWEQGTRSPGPLEARTLARVLGVSAAHLLCVDEESVLTPEEQALLGKYRVADRRGKDAIQGTADTQSAYTVNPSRKRV